MVKSPKTRVSSTDPIRGTNLERKTLQYVCPECDTDLELKDSQNHHCSSAESTASSDDGDRDNWVRYCPSCDYEWQPTDGHQTTI
jgi:ssDNA-binding Zn-finger/Zn-ribbon topoisomerase 1